MFNGLLKLGAGLAGVSAFVFASIYNQWLQLKVFSSLTSEQTFYALLVSLLLLFIFSITLLLLHYKEKKPAGNSASATDNGIAIVNPGNGNVSVKVKGKV